MVAATLRLYERLQVLHVALLNFELMAQSISFNLEVIHLLCHEALVLLQLRHETLKALLIVFLRLAHLLVIADLDLKFVALLLDLAHRLVSQL